MMMKIALRFVLTVAAYLAFAGQLSLDECVAGAAAGAAVTVLSLVGHDPRRPRFQFRPLVVLGQVAAALPKLVTDSLAIIPSLLRPGWRIGAMSQEFVPGGNHVDDPAWWAVFTLATSLPPNSFVISRLARPGEVIVHRLTERRGQ